MYIYMYIKRERERERIIYIYIYIIVFTCRARARPAQVYWRASVMDGRAFHRGGVAGVCARVNTSCIYIYIYMYIHIYTYICDMLLYNYIIINNGSGIWDPQLEICKFNLREPTAGSSPVIIHGRVLRSSSRWFSGEDVTDPQQISTLGCDALLSHPTHILSESQLGWTGPSTLPTPFFLCEGAHRMRWGAWPWRGGCGGSKVWRAAGLKDSPLNNITMCNWKSFISSWPPTRPRSDPAAPWSPGPGRLRHHPYVYPSIHPCIWLVCVCAHMCEDSSHVPPAFEAAADVHVAGAQRACGARPGWTHEGCRWDRNPRPQLGPQITSLETCNIN